MTNRDKYAIIAISKNAAVFFDILHILFVGRSLQEE